MSADEDVKYYRIFRRLEQNLEFIGITTNKVYVDKEVILCKDVISYVVEAISYAQELLASIEHKLWYFC